MTLYIIPILVNLVSNALYSLLTNSLPDDADNSNLEQSIKKIIDDLSHSFEWKGSLKVEEVCIFLDSPEIQQVIEQLFSIDLSENNFVEEIVEKEFLLLFSKFFQNHSETDVENIKLIFNLINATVINVLTLKANNKGFKELLAIINFRNNRIESIINGLAKNIEFLAKETSVSIKEINEFERKYRSQVAERLRSIKLYNLDTIRKLPIDDIYVTPKIRLSRFQTTYYTDSLFPKIKIGKLEPNSFRYYLSKTKKLPIDIGSHNLAHKFSDDSFYLKAFESVFEEINYSRISAQVYERLTQAEEIEEVEGGNFYSLINKTVVLGNPGGGKSTLTYKICSDLDKYYDKRLINNKLLTPIHVTVREYGEDKKNHNWSILQHLEAVSNSHYQLPVPNGSFEFLLHNNRVLLIFDGLDELLDTSYRREIVDDIESFCNLYPSTPVLITSREVGYEQSPLDAKKFTTYKLAPFDENQIREYAEKWFKLDTDLTNQQQKEKVKAFLKESEVAIDIRSNPLMLGLMCSIYRGENYIPQNRPDLYEKCSVMLFEKWDKSRGINPNIQFEAHLRPGMMFLAHWIYTTPNLQGGVKESLLIQETTDYLKDFYENRNVAELVAKQFVDFCKGRAWVFTDVGDGIYQFTHQTFLEYFTASHLIRKLRTTDSVYNQLSIKIQKAEWDVVAQLCVQILDKTFENAADEMLNLLINEFKTNSNLTQTEQSNILDFVTRCVGFIVPLYSTKQKIVEDSINFVIKFILDKNVDGSPLNIDNKGLINNLLRTNSENRDSFINIFQNFLIEEINSAQNDRLKIIFAIAFHIEDLLSNDTVKKIKRKIEGISNNSKFNVLLKYHYGLISEKELFNSFGLKILLGTTNKIDNYFQPISKPLIFLILHYLSDNDLLQEDKQKKASKLLIALSDSLTINNISNYWVTFSSINKDLLINKTKDSIPKSELFGAFIILAVMIERNLKSQSWIRKSLKKKLILGDALGDVFIGRIIGVKNHSSQVKSCLEKLDLSNEQKDIIWKWANKEIKFLKKT